MFFISHLKIVCMCTGVWVSILCCHVNSISVTHNYLLPRVFPLLSASVGLFLVCIHFFFFFAQMSFLCGDKDQHIALCSLCKAKGSIQRNPRFWSRSSHPVSVSTTVVLEGPPRSQVGCLMLFPSDHNRK